MVNSTYIKKRGFVFLFLISVFAVNAQEDERYTQYLYNPIGINPAFAGSRGTTSIFGSYRTQWVGVPGAPKTILVSANGVAKNKTVGLGLSVVNDKIGPSDQSAIAADFSYTITLTPKYKLAFGLKGSANLLNVDYNKLYIKDDNDNAFENNIDNKFSPNVGLGLYLHSDNTSIGLSVPNLLETKFYDKYAGSGSVSKIAKSNMDVFFTADHLFELSPDLELKPALLVKVTRDGPLQTYISSTFLVQQKVTAGLSYRFGGTINTLVGFQVNNKIFIGYSYDLETKALHNYNTGSHEIFMRFDLFPRGNK